MPMGARRRLGDDADRPGDRPPRLLALLACLTLLAGACGGDEAVESVAAADPLTEEPPEPDIQPARDPDPDADPEPNHAKPADEETDEPEDEAEPDPAGEGTPQDPQPMSHTAGTLTVSAVRCTVDGPAFVADRSSDAMPGVAVAGDQVYLTNGEGEVLRFTAATDDGCTLTIDDTWGQGGIFTPTRDRQSAVDIVGDRLAISGAVFETEVVDVITGGTYACGVPGTTVIRPDGGSGVAFFPGSAIREVTFSDTGCTVDDPAPLAAQLPFDTQTLTAGHFLDDGTLLAGGSLPGNTAVVAAFAPDGTELWRHGSEDDGHVGDQRYGWVHGITSCGPGVCTVDTNFRRLQVLDAAGGWLTSVDLNDLLGVQRAWWEAVADDDQGRLWMPVGASRQDGDVADGFLFLVTFEGP